MITVLFIVYEYLSLTRPSVLLNDPNAIVTAWLLAMATSCNGYRSVVTILTSLVQPTFLRALFILENSGWACKSSGLIEKVMGSAVQMGLNGYSSLEFMQVWILFLWMWF